MPCISQSNAAPWLRRGEISMMTVSQIYCGVIRHKNSENRPANSKVTGKSKAALFFETQRLFQLFRVTIYSYSTGGYAIQPGLNSDWNGILILISRAQYQLSVDMPAGKTHVQLHNAPDIYGTQAGRVQ